MHLNQVKAKGIILAKKNLCQWWYEPYQILYSQGLGGAEKQVGKEN